MKKEMQKTPYSRRFAFEFHQSKSIYDKIANWYCDSETQELLNQAFHALIPVDDLEHFTMECFRNNIAEGFIAMHGLIGNDEHYQFFPRSNGFILTLDNPVHFWGLFFSLSYLQDDLPQTCKLKYEYQTDEESADYIYDASRLLKYLAN